MATYRMYRNCLSFWSDWLRKQEKVLPRHVTTWCGTEESSPGRPEAAVLRGACLLGWPREPPGSLDVGRAPAIPRANRSDLDCVCEQPALRRTPAYLPGVWTFGSRRREAACTSSPSKAPGAGPPVSLPGRRFPWAVTVSCWRN